MNGFIITLPVEKASFFIDSRADLGYILSRKVVIPMEITIGMKGEASTLVEREDTAATVGSGDLLVYATPCMAALMEGAACEAIAPALAEGTTSVGTMLSIVPTLVVPSARAGAMASQAAPSIRAAMQGVA